MRKNWFTTAVLAMSCLCAVPAMAQDKKPADSPPAGQKPVAKPANAPVSTRPGAPIAVGAVLDESLSVVDADGKPQFLKDHRNKIVVLHFFGMQSATTAGYAARLKKLSDEYSGKGVEFIAVDANVNEVDWADKEPTKRVREWAAKQGFTSVMFDKNHSLADRLAATVNGHTFVIDAKGALRYSGMLDDDPKGEHGERANNYLKGALDALIAGKLPERLTSPATGDPIVREAKREEKKSEPAKKDEKKATPVGKKKADKPEKKDPAHN